MEYDPSNPAIQADPYPVFAYLRHNDPVHLSPPLGGWLLTRHQDVREVLASDTVSADRLRPFFKHVSDRQRGQMANLMRYLNLWVVFTDPPEHSRLRALLNQAFNPNLVNETVPFIDALVAETIEPLRKRDRFDLIADFAHPLPATVIMRLLGVPVADLAVVKQWSNDLVLFVGGARLVTNKYELAEAAAHQMAAYFSDLLDAPPPQEAALMQALLAIRNQETDFDDDDLVATCMLLLLAGHETTTNLIGNGVYWMLRHRKPWQLLVERPDLASLAAEECLRFDGPVGGLVRVVARECELGGKRLREGERVFAMLTAANRDPAAFENPDVMDIERKPNRHLAFGRGVHFCLGSMLARVEGRAALASLARNLPQISLEPGEACWRDSIGLRGLGALPVRNIAA